MYQATEAYSNLGLVKEKWRVDKKRMKEE